jgi:biopolymer transport protein ExbD
MKLRRRLDEGGSLPLTPLIDVMLQVLFYYMLTASVAVSPALRVDLPEAYNSTGAVEGELVVTIGASGEISVGALAVPDEKLSSALREAAARDGTARMLLLADASIPYRTLVSVMDKARSAGIETITLGALKAPQPPR